MLCSEIFAPRALREAVPHATIARVEMPKRGEVDVGHTVAHVNPSTGDMARILTQSSSLRALTEPGRFVCWPAAEELHQPVQIALGLSDRARRYFVYGSTSSEHAASKVGRYYVRVKDAANALVKPQFMGNEMRAALGVR